MTEVTTVDGDRLDLICWRHYGSLDGRVVEQVLDAAQGLAMVATFPAGTVVPLPDVAIVPRERSLW